jgi:hypothetical protein
MDRFLQQSSETAVERLTSCEVTRLMVALLFIQDAPRSRERAILYSWPTNRLPLLPRDGRTTAEMMLFLKRPDIAALVLLLAVVAGIPVITKTAHGSRTRGTSAPLSHAILAITAPVRVWHFLPAAAPRSNVLLTFATIDAYPVRVWILSKGSVVRRISVPASSSAEVELPAREAAQVTIRATGSIVPGRLVLRGNTATLSYGLPGAVSSNP